MSSLDVGGTMTGNITVKEATVEPQISPGNGTNETATPELDIYYFYEEQQFAVLWILFLLIVLGNSAVLVALYLDKKRKSRMNFFIMQLAIADLTVGVFYVLTDIIWRMTVAWYAGNLGCKFIRFLQAVVIYSSTYVLVALSIDRYDAITHPMNFSGSTVTSEYVPPEAVPFSRPWTTFVSTSHTLGSTSYVHTICRRARILVFLAWFFSVLFSIPIIILYEERFVQKKLQCWIDFTEQWQWQVYLTLISISVFFLPAIIISGCYAVIIFTVWNKGKILNSPSAKKTGVKQRMFVRTTLYTDELESRRASSRGLIPRAKIKTVKMTFVIVFVFILCWSPYFIFGLLQVYGYFPQDQKSTAMASFIQSLAPLNSAANPLIYCAFSSHFCRTLRKSLPFKWFGAMTDTPDKSFGSGTGAESLTTSRKSRISLRHQHHIKMPTLDRKHTETTVTAV